MTRIIQQRPSPGRSAVGFSLLEICVAMAVFLIVGGTALTLFSRHETLLSREQGVTGLNIGLRNALSQIQIDAVNAGSGVITGGVQIPSWPVGVTISNNNPNASPVCNPSLTGSTPGIYTGNCFDALNIVMVDPNTPPLQLISSYGNVGGSTCLNTNSTGASGSCTAAASVITNESTNTVTGSLPSGYSSGTYYSNWKVGDKILLVDVVQQSGEQLFTTATLTAGGSNASPNITLTFDETQPGGFNYGATVVNDPLGMTTPYCYVGTNAGPPASPTVTWASSGSSTVSNYFVTTTTNGQQTWAGQPIQIGNILYTISSVQSTTSLTLSNNASATITSGPMFTSQALTSTFFTGDFVLRLLPIQYSISVANSSDPQLVRTQAGTSSVVMDQVIGFKVGAVWWNSSIDINSFGDFQYDYQSTDYGNNFSLVRAVRVTIIGRTAPSSDPTYMYTNPFDGGRYQIRGNSIVVNPRNLTMSND